MLAPFLIAAPLALVVAAPSWDESDDAMRRRVTPIVQVVRDAAPAVVYIETEGVAYGRNIFGYLYSQQVRGAGSGVVLTKNGLIITNYHVVKDAKRLLVSFDKQYDAEVYTAELVGAVEQEDLALLKITASAARKEFPTIPLGTSSDLMPGEDVIAIGNPLGQTHTVTRGIISGLHRNVQIPQAGLEFDNLIQTDTGINPGNSGGPLLNINGELIGITSAMNGAAQNIAFAIPIDRVKQVLAERLLAPDSAPSWLGFEVEASDHLQIRSVVLGSPAEKAGLRPGDCVIAVAGHSVTNQEEYRLARVGLSAAKPVELKVVRDGKPRDLALQPWDRTDGMLFEHVGFKVAPANVGNSRRLRITEIRDKGPAATLGLEVGDVLDAVRPDARAGSRAYRFDKREDFAAVIAQLEKGSRLEVEVYRDLDRNGVLVEDELHRGMLTID